MGLAGMRREPSGAAPLIGPAGMRREPGGATLTVGDMSARDVSTGFAATGLGTIAAVHLAWAAGSSWPLADRSELADAVVGRAGGGVPPPSACVAVAGALTIASALIGGRPAVDPRLRRAGARATVAVLGVRGSLGLLGRTDILSPGSASPRFRRLDRRIYSPLCLALAALALPAGLNSSAR